MWQLIVYTIIVFFNFCTQEVLAELCEKGIYCHEPYRCCELKAGCCYDQVLHTNRHFRLQIWNLWYFWFLIIFMMMSCFGGCGYYRRRRLAVLTRTSTNDNRPLTLMPPQHRVFRAQPTRGRDFTLLSYNNMGVNAIPVTNLPPSYAEIVDHPDLYPATKIDLPPYTAPEKPGEGSGADVNHGVSQTRPDASLPPPYSEYPLPSHQNQSNGTNSESQGSTVVGQPNNINSNSNNH